MEEPSVDRMPISIDGLPIRGGKEREREREEEERESACREVTRPAQKRKNC